MKIDSKKAIRARADHLVETLRDCCGVDEEAAVKFLSAVAGDESEPVPDEVIDFMITYGQSLDWLHRGDATPMIRMLRRRHEALNGIRCSVERACD